MAVGDGMWYAGDTAKVQLLGACSKPLQAAASAATLPDSLKDQEDLHRVKAERSSYSFKTTVLLACSDSL